jgi:hypothetical protein
MTVLLDCHLRGNDVLSRILRFSFSALASTRRGNGSSFRFTLVGEWRGIIKSLASLLSTKRGYININNYIQPTL